MKIRTDVIGMLRTGATTTEIMDTLHVGQRTVVAARTALGMPAPRRGGRPLRSIPELFHAHTEAVDGGHLRWTGYLQKGVPLLGRRGGNLTVYRVAFELKHGRKPVGQARATCGYPRCVAPDHVQDRPMRDRLDATYTAIFGDVAV